jgi:bacterioferritin-associated ferredoxin
MIVCLCRGLSDRAIRAAIQDGADTPRKVATACGAGADCGACCSFVRALLDETEGASFEAAPSPYLVAEREPR